MQLIAGGMQQRLGSDTFGMRKGDTYLAVGGA